MFHMWCCTGQRISASTSSTRRPSCAIAAAKLALTVDLPSLGTELLTTTAFKARSLERNFKLACSIR